MKYLHYLGVLLFFIISNGCTGNKQNSPVPARTASKAPVIRYANGLKISRFRDYTLVTVSNPWPGATQAFTYVLYKKGAVVPDSLSAYTSIQVPLQRVVVTSTTHIPSLELLGVENTLVGFPGTGYVSSPRTRKRIDAGKVKEAGANENLNTEVLIDLAPDAVIGFSISSNNKALQTLEKSGISVLYNGDWTEQSPLGRAEWIKFFGALYGRENEADSIFDKIEKDYLSVKQLAQKAQSTPTVFSGAMYQDHWYMPQGDSWAALFIKDAHATYLWAGDKGTGSLSLPFETVLDRAVDADYWIGPSQFTSLGEIAAANQHYKKFRAYQKGKVYSFSSRKGATGGIIYYEVASNRPDLVLKDLVNIFHPGLLKEDKLYFFEKLK